MNKLAKESQIEGSDFSQSINRTMKYYRLLNDVEIPKRWFLGGFKEGIDFWTFVAAGEIKNIPTSLTIKIRKEGIPLDFTMADFDVLVVNEKASKLFKKSDVQLIPVSIDNLKINNKHFLMIIKREIDCVDETNSKFEKFEKNDPIRPDLAGEYSGISKLIINPLVVEGSDIFRIKNYDIAIIISEILKKEFENNVISGVRFQQVTLGNR